MEDTKKIGTGDADQDVMNIFRNQRDRVKAEEQDRIDTNVRVEAARYRKAQRQFRQRCHVMDKAMMFASGMGFSAAILQVIRKNAWGVLIALIVSFGAFCVSAVFDNQSRYKKGGEI